MALDYVIGSLQLLSAAVNVLALGAFWISPSLRATANRFVINLLVANIIACLALTPALWLNGGLKTRFHMDNNVAATVESIYQVPHLKFESDIRKLPNDDKSISAIESDTVNPLHHRHHHHRGGKVERDVEEYVDVDQSKNFVTQNNVQESIESLVIERDERGNIRKFTEKQVVDIQNGDEKDVIELVEEVAAEPVAVVSERALEVEAIATIKQRSSSTAHRTHTVFSENALIFDCTRFWGFDFAAAVGKAYYQF